VALGITWILDGLEVTIAGAVAGALQQSPSLRLSATEIGLSASAYLAGAVSGAAFFGYLTDRLGRKLLVQRDTRPLSGRGGARRLSWSFWSYALFRFLTGAGIGGEYTAINSAIQEPIPVADARLDRSSSTAASGSARRWARSARSCCSIRPTSRPTSAGGSPLSSAPRWRW